jgi:hypothetical protein
METYYKNDIEIIFNIAKYINRTFTYQTVPMAELSGLTLFVLSTQFLDGDELFLGLHFWLVKALYII